MCCTTNPFLLSMHPYITIAVYKESDKNEHLLQSLYVLKT